MYRECEHGVLHPDPDDAHFRISSGRVAGRSAYSHRDGCDMCCMGDSFPPGDWIPLGSSYSFPEAQEIASDLHFAVDSWLYSPDERVVFFNRNKRKA